MSIAPANSASMAAGPALKLFHSIFACGPTAFSNQPLALPIMACGCVMLGKAPTRITTSCAPHCAIPASTNAKTASSRLRVFIRAPVAAHDHRKYARLGLLARPLVVSGLGSIRDVSKAGALENLGGCVAHLQENFVESTMRNIPINLVAQRICVSQRGQRTVDEANDLAEKNLGRRSA